MKSWYNAVKKARRHKLETQLPWYRTKRARVALVILLLIIGILVRFVHLGDLPSGVDQDEAMAAYLAYTTLTEGIDITGYHNPVYFEAWGNGMNALEIYLMIPMIQIFGLTDLAMRLPQAILGVLSLPVFFLLLRRIFGERTAFVGLFLLAINPWHIMMSRWALESNLAPAFLLFGLYFFVLGLEKHQAYFLVSAFLYGLCLYTYAIMWVVVPVTLLLQILYAMLTRRARVTWYTAGFVVICGLMALPLLLLFVVNMHYLPEIKTALFSIPELGSWRGRELSLGNLINWGSYLRLFNFLSAQSEGNIRSSFSQYGFYYLFSAPLMLLGLIKVVRDCVALWKRRAHALETYVLIQLFAALLIALMLSEINANRINCIHIPLILLCAVGVSELLNLNWKLAGQAVLALYCACFLSFAGFYFTEGQNQLSGYYRPGTKEAIAYAQKLTDETIHCRMHGRYSIVLYYTKMPLDRYFSTVKYKEPPYPDPVSFDQFVFESPHATNTGNAVYIVEDDELATYTDAGYTIEPFGRMAVAYLPGELGE